MKTNIHYKHCQELKDSKLVDTVLTNYRQVPMRKLVALAFLLLGITGSAMAQSDLSWVGVNTNTGFYMNTSFVAESNYHTNQLGLGIVRMGMDGVQGSDPTDSFAWSARDATVNAHLAAGLEIHSVVSPWSHVSKGASTTEWKNNFRHFCENVFARYEGKISYYIVDNEPDLKGTSYTPQIAVDMTQIAYEVANQVDPAIRIESPPTASPGKTYLKNMIDLGLTQYCDVLGVHSYSSQIDDQHFHNLGKPVQWMTQANATSGYPIRPVASSESGVSANWAPTGIDQRLWQARWFRQAWIAHKRWGYDNLLLYSLSRSGAGDSWNISLWDALATDLIPYQPTYDAIKNAYDLTPFANGNFELENDKELGWAINYGVEQADPFEWGRITFPRTDATNSRGGSGHIRMNMELDAPAKAINTRRVRRVVETLTPNSSYTVTAYVRIVGGGTASLKVQGYNPDKGSDEVSMSTTTIGSWQKLEVTFTPRRTWAVISLEGAETGAGRLIFWDDVSLTLGGGVNPPPPVNSYIRFEAESATESAPLVEVTDVNASGTKYIVYPSGSTNETPVARATYTFNVTQAGNYRIWARVKTPDSGASDSYWVKVDGGNWIKWNGIAGGNASSWTWDEVHNSDNSNQLMLYNLSVGSHTLQISNREDGTRLDKWVITDDMTYTPTGIEVNESYLFLEAESTSEGAPLVEGSDNDASGGKHVWFPSGSLNGTPVARATYTFNVTEAGIYKIWGRTKVPSTGNSFWVKVDGGSWINWNGITGGTATNWTWDEVHDSDNSDQVMTYNLAVGSHTLQLSEREPGPKLDSWLITNDLAHTPTGITSFAVTNTNTVSLDLNEVKEADFKIYPNPTANVVTVETSFETGTVSIVSVSGQKVYDGKITGLTNRIDVSNINPGLYIIIVKGNNKVTTTKLQIVK